MAALAGGCPRRGQRSVWGGNHAARPGRLCGSRHVQKKRWVGWRGLWRAIAKDDVNKGRLRKTHQRARGCHGRRVNAERQSFDRVVVSAGAGSACSRVSGTCSLNENCRIQKLEANLR